jgi:hypothetical protein
MILISVFENIKRKCFPSPRGWVMGHCSVGSAGRDTCLLVTLLESECFSVIGMQTDDIFGFGDEAFITKESKELVFAAKEKQFLTPDNALLFNGCILTLVGDILRLRQKNQGKKLEKATDSPTYVQQRAREAYIAIICQPEASFNLSAAAQVTDPGKEEIARLNRRINW